MCAPHFTALLLAGGRSSRMGTDKSSLIIDGKPLWQHQIETLRATGAAAVVVAGPKDGPFAKLADKILEDDQPGLGPLSGIVSGLEWNPSPLLLVLAIDLPAMTPQFLTKLVKSATINCGVVPQGEQWFEPLAAVYPRQVLPLAEKHLASPNRSLQNWVSTCEKQSLLRVQALADD